MQRPRIAMLIGIPGSGKTFFREKFFRTERTIARDNYIIICPDEIRKEIFGVIFDKKYEEHVWNIVYFMMNKILEAGFNIIFDATNFNRKFRKTIFEKFSDIADIDGYWLDTSYRTCKKRRKNFPEEVLNKINVSFEKPDKREGFKLLWRVEKGKIYSLNFEENLI